MSDLERKIVKALSAGSVRAVDLEIILESYFWCDFVTPTRRAGVAPSMCRLPRGKNGCPMVVLEHVLSQVGG
jgi:hypothetical protein